MAACCLDTTHNILHSTRPHPTTPHHITTPPNPQHTMAYMLKSAPSMGLMGKASATSRRSVLARSGAEKPKEPTKIEVRARVAGVGGRVCGGSGDGALTRSQPPPHTPLARHPRTPSHPHPHTTAPAQNIPQSERVFSDQEVSERCGREGSPCACTHSRTRAVVCGHKQPAPPLRHTTTTTAEPLGHTMYLAAVLGAKCLATACISLSRLGLARATRPGPRCQPVVYASCHTTQSITLAPRAHRSCTLTHPPPPPPRSGTTP